MSKARPSVSKTLFELLSSMRFAISLLSILAIASIIGTVLKQNQPYPDYIVQFGAFWFALFKDLGLFDVYHAGWFLVILAFLVTSTSLCIYRHTPIMLHEMRAYREAATEQSLRHISHSAEFSMAYPATTAAERLGQYLTQAGYHFRRRERGSQILIAAKKGSYHRLGYILTHVAIVVICLGGLIDGNLPFKVEQVLGLKKIETRDLPQSQVPPISRLSPNALSFRGNVTIPEGSSADVLFIDVGNGYLVQDLPFIVTVKKFKVDYYTTGQPKLFASDLVVTDRATGKSFNATISVNHPLTYKGVSIYQASFGDGGSHLKLNSWNLTGPQAAPVPLTGTVKTKEPIVVGQKPYTIEFDDFRMINVQDMSMPTPAKQAGGMQELRDVLKSDHRENKNLKNVGPSFQYKIRDSHGVAHEYQNYMLPMTFNHRQYFITGMRSSPAEDFQYIRFPLDDRGAINGYMQWRAVMSDPALAPQIAQQFAATALAGTPDAKAMRGKLVEVTENLLKLFAQGGYDSLAGMISKAVPAAEQEKAAQTYLKLLQGAALEAYRIARQRQHLAPPPDNIDTALFVRDSLNAMSDSFLYGAPVYLQLTGFDPIMASGLQMTRSPGKYIVYLGSFLLVLGVLVMFYIRERRLWLLLRAEAGSVLMAMSSNRKTLDFDREYELLKHDLSTLMKE